MGNVLARSVGRSVGRSLWRLLANRALRRAGAVLVAVLAAALVLTAARRAAAQWKVPVDRGVTTIARIPVYLEAGTRYRYRTYGISWPTDPVMYLLDSTNMSVAENDDVAYPDDLNSQIEYAVTATGTYYLVVRAYSEFTPGLGGIEWMSTTFRDWPATWTNLSPEEHFGGRIGQVQPNQPEYRTVMRQPVRGGCTDTVLYSMDIGLQITNFNDDGGVGRMDQIYQWFTSYPVEYLLVGAYSATSVGGTDVIANDVDDDVDGDGLGPGLETALGTCDSYLMAPECGPTSGTVINYWDSDHDGLSDAAEAFGVDWPADKLKAVHFPAWGANPRKKDVFIEQDIGTQRTCSSNGLCTSNADCPARWLCESSGVGMPKVCVEQWYSTDQDPCWPASATTSNPFTEAEALQVQGKFDGATEAEIRNRPLAGGGIALHYDIGSSGDPCPTNQFLCGAWGGGGDRVMSHELHEARRGLFRHMRVDAGEGGQNVGGTPGVAFQVGGANRLRNNATHEKRRPMTAGDFT